MASEIWLDDIQRNDLDDLIGQTRIALYAREEAVARLLRTAFRSPQIVERFINQVDMRGTETAIEIAQGRHALPRAMWFGPLRGDPVFERGQRTEALAAIGQLPDFVHDAMRLRDELRDLTATRDRLGPERVARVQSTERTADRSNERTQDRQWVRFRSSNTRKR